MTRILIVEDHAESRYLLEQLLTSRGHQVVPAENGAEALSMAREDPPDVIISDIMMPVMNGFKLCCEVKKEPALKHIPFIFYTATFIEENDRKLAMGLGASRFVVKPAEGDAFIKILEEVLKEHRNGILPVPEGPIEDPETLIDMYENAITRKLAETVERLQDERRALIQSEQRLKEAQELAHIGHWELDLKTGSLEWSDEIYRILGLTPGAFDPSYKTLMSHGIIHPEDRHFVTRAHKESLSKKTPLDIEYRLLLEDGTVKYVNEKFQTLYDEEGMPACSMGTVQDVTERKEAERAQRESEARYKILFEEALDGICIADADTGVIMDCNPALAALVERDLTELIGQPQSILHPPHANGDGLSPSFREHLTHKEGQTLETEVLTRSGEIKYVEIKANRLDLSGREALQGIFRDITERKEAVHALGESEEKYRTLVENAGEVILVAQEGQIKFLNRRVVDLLGYKPEQLVGTSFVDYIHPEDRQTVVERHSRRLKGEELPRIYPFRVTDKAGNTKWVEINAIRIEWEGKPATLNFLADVTERVRSEEEREKLRDQLHQAQKMESIGRLAGGVAHDFNNMLSVIQGHTDLALLDVDPGDPVCSSLGEISKAAKRSSNVVRQLLAFARKQTIAPEMLNLNDTVEGMLKMLRRLIGEDTDLSWHPDTNLWLVKVDPAQIDQILANLCVNARDAISGIGRITIETGNVVLKASDCDGHAGFLPGEYVALAVTDDGVGMDRETLANVFEPFFTTKEVGKGTGLGLSTVYGIVSQNHGFIDMISEPGKGTTARIYLPRRRGESEEVIQESKTEMPRGHGETVLIVEDDAQVLDIGRQILERLGYTVLATASPGEAILLAREFDAEIHLLMTDIVMPEMSGKELAAKIVATRPNINILFMSGYTADIIARHGILDRGTHFIQKPFTPDVLARKIRDALGSEK